jgi:hypothetical protein
MQRVANPSSFNFDARVQISYSPLRNKETPLQLGGFSLYPLSNLDDYDIIRLTILITSKMFIPESKFKSPFSI